MKNKIYYSRQALCDLDDIWDAIALGLDNPSAAERTVNKILETASLLEEFALMGAPLSSITDITSAYRFLVSGEYLVFYRTENTAVYIDRILPGSCDYLRVLLKDKKYSTN